MKNILIGQAFMFPSYLLIGMANFAAPDMGLFLTFMAWAAVAMIVGGIAGILWVNHRPALEVTE